MTLHHPSPTSLAHTQGSNGSGARRSNEFLSSLSAADLTELRPHLKERDLSSGECLYRPGQLIDWVIFPLSGIVSLTVPTKSGLSVETAMIGREGVVGAGAGFGIPHASCKAAVQIPGAAFAIPAGHFRDAVARNASVRELAARCDAALLAQAQQSAACNALHDVEHRLARWLLETHDRADGDELPLTQNFLAEMLGVQRTTVTLIAGKLQKTGAIRNFRGRIQVADRAILEAAACECYERIRTCAQQLFAAGDYSSGQSYPSQQNGLLA